MNTKPAANKPSSQKAVFLVGDQPIVRQELALLINGEADLRVCGEAEDMQSALRAIASAAPDILVIDASLGGQDGFELLKNIRLRSPRLPVLILSMHDESIHAERVLRAGADGYILKQEATEKLLVALRRILSGEIYVSERIANSMLQRYVRGGAYSVQSTVAELTEREREVFRLIGEGYGTRQIAAQLHLSVKTVESYQAHIKDKLSLRSARELVQHAVQWTVGEKPA